jgi:hypothetical protein
MIKNLAWYLFVLVSVAITLVWITAAIANCARVLSNMDKGMITECLPVIESTCSEGECRVVLQNQQHVSVYDKVVIAKDIVCKIVYKDGKSAYVRKPE